MRIVNIEMYVVTVFLQICFVLHIFHYVDDNDKFHYGSICLAILLGRVYHINLLLHVLLTSYSWWFRFGLKCMSSGHLSFVNATYFQWNVVSSIKDNACFENGPHVYCHISCSCYIIVWYKNNDNLLISSWQFWVTLFGHRKRLEIMMAGGIWTKT